MTIDINLTSMLWRINQAFRRILLVQKILERTMVSGMIDDIIFQKSQPLVKSQKGVYIVLKNNVMPLETVITSWPGSIANEN